MHSEKALNPPTYPHYYYWSDLVTQSSVSRITGYAAAQWLVGMKGFNRKFRCGFASEYISRRKWKRQPFNCPMWSHVTDWPERSCWYDWGRGLRPWWCKSLVDALQGQEVTAPRFLLLYGDLSCFALLSSPCSLFLLCKFDSSPAEGLLSSQLASLRSLKLSKFMSFSSSSALLFLS